MTAPNTLSQIAKLDTRVTQIEGSLDKIGTSIDKIGSKLDERSRTPWAVLVSCGLLLLALLGVIGTAWKAPIDSTLARQDYDVRMMQQTIVPRVEHEGQWQALQRDAEDFRRRLDRLEAPVFTKP